jgi:hypothetical protein
MPGENGQHPSHESIRSLVLRAWLEPGAVPRLRIRIADIDPTPTGRPAMVTTSVDQACKAVRCWLEALRLHDPGGPEQ